MEFIWGRKRGGRDIQLPAEGKRDPRLGSGDTLEDLKKFGASLRGLQDVLGEQSRAVTKKSKKSAY